MYLLKLLLDGNCGFFLWQLTNKLVEFLFCQLKHSESHFKCERRLVKWTLVKMSAGPLCSKESDKLALKVILYGVLECLRWMCFHGNVQTNYTKASVICYQNYNCFSSFTETYVLKCIGCPEVVFLLVLKRTFFVSSTFWRCQFTVRSALMNISIRRSMRHASEHSSK